MRYDEPDFVALLADGTHVLTEISWRYVKVPQKGFEQLHADEFADLTVLVPSGFTV